MPISTRSCLPSGKACSRFVSFWRDSQSQAWNDVRSRWRRGAFWFLFASICACIGLLYLNPYFSFRKSNQYNAYLPDGSFRTDPESFGYWSKSGFFQITLGFGSMTFTQAKTIDIIWDIVFGRGGQALLALVSWRVFANYLTVSMETTPVTFLTYRTIFLQDQSLVIAIPRIVRDFSFRLSLQSKSAMIFMIATMTFILAFPTLGSAMTGYSGNVRSFVPDKSGNFIPFTSFQYLLYVIHDGWRINETGEFAVSYSDAFFGESILNSYDVYHEPPCHYGYLRSPDFFDQCYTLTNVSHYVEEHGFFGLKNKSSVFKGIELQPPVLNISAFYLPPYVNDTGWAQPSGLLNGSGWMDPRTREVLFTNNSRMAWTSSNQTYDYTYIKEHGTCQAVENYQWGFSFIQLNLMVMFLLLWAIGIYIMWLGSYLTLKQRGQRDVAGEHKAILELANAMHALISDENSGVEHVKDISILAERELRRCFMADLNGGKVSYQASLLKSEKIRGGDLEWGFVTWLKTEKWWLFSLFSVCGGSISMGYYRMLFHGWVTLGFTLAILLTVSIGSTARSRGLLFFWLFWILTALPMVVIWVCYIYDTWC